MLNAASSCPASCLPKLFAEVEPEITPEGVIKNLGSPIVLLTTMEYGKYIMMHSKQHGEHVFCGYL